MMVLSCGKCADVAALGIDIEHAVEAAVEFHVSLLPKSWEVIRDCAHARHDPHADRHVNRVGQLDASLASGEPGGPIKYGTTFNGPAAHCARSSRAASDTFPWAPSNCLWGPLAPGPGYK